MMCMSQFISVGGGRKKTSKYKNTLLFLSQLKYSNPVRVFFSQENILSLIPKFLSGKETKYF